MTDRICQGRVCIVTGAGRGIGREHALLLAAHGANVRGQRLRRRARRQRRRRRPGPGGGRRDHRGRRRGGGQRRRRVVVRRRRARWCSRPSTLFGGLDVLVNNAGILRDRMIFSMTEDEWDAVIRVHLKGTFAPTPPRRRVLARPGEGGRDERRPRHQHHVGVGHLRQRRPDQLRRRQGRHRRLHADRRRRAGPLRRHRQRHRPRRAHPDDRGPRPPTATPNVGAAVGRPARDVAGLDGVGRCHRPGHRELGQLLAVAEGWHRGPRAARPPSTPAEVGPVLRELLASVRPRGTMANG